MGLDMFLRAKRDVSPWMNTSETKLAEDIQAMFPELKERVSCFGDSSPVSSVEIEAGYWRKANQIHRWFVHNVQNGVDDCGNYYVHRHTLRELHQLCTEILDNPELAHAKLPTSSGFFFGNTEYNEGYFHDLRSTVLIVNFCLSLPPEWHFNYHSSW